MNKYIVISLFVLLCMQASAQQIPLPDSSDCYYYRIGSFVPEYFIRRIYQYNSEEKLETLSEFREGKLIQKTFYSYHSPGKESQRLIVYSENNKRKYEKRYDSKGNVIFDMCSFYDSITQQFVHMVGDSMLITYDSNSRPKEEIIYKFNRSRFYPDSKHEFLNYDAKGPRIVKIYLYSRERAGWIQLVTTEHFKWHEDFDLYRSRYDNTYIFPDAYNSQKDSNEMRPTTCEISGYTNNKVTSRLQMNWDGTSTRDSLSLVEYTYDDHGNRHEEITHQFFRNSRSFQSGFKHATVYGTHHEKKELFNYVRDFHGDWYPESKEIFYYGD